MPNRRLKILVLGLNYAPELIGIAVYTTGLAEAMAARGHTVQVVAGKPYYPMWSVSPEYRGGWRRRRVENGVSVTRVAHYVPATPSGVRRLLHHASFALSSLVPMLMKARSLKPDIVIAIAPSLIAAPVAKAAAVICGARSWLHVQDFEAEAAMATGLIGTAGVTERLALWVERTILRTFDHGSSISPAMCSKLADKMAANDSMMEFRNWVDVDAIAPMTVASPYRAEWNITTPHVVLYSGNIANKQGIEIVVAAARHLAGRSDVTFVVCGEGPNLASLQAFAVGLDNIRFHDLQPKERLGELLGLATVHLLPQRAGAADLVLPSKLTGILASGRPVVATAMPGTGLADEVEGCGLVVLPEDEDAFATAISRLLDDENERMELGRAARQRAIERWDRNAIISRFEATLLQLVRGDARV